METLIERFEKQRLPRILAVKVRADQGHRLEQSDLDFLDDVLADAKQNAHIIAGIPGCHDLFGRIVHLYNEITAKALENERGG